MTDEGIDLANIRDLTGIGVRCLDGDGQQHLRFISASHPYLHGVELGTDRVTMKSLRPFFYVEDPGATALGVASCREGSGAAHGTRKPGFAVRKFNSWTSVYCSVPVLPPGVLRNIAREARVHIYTDTDDAVAATTGCSVSAQAATARAPSACRGRPPSWTL